MANKSDFMNSAKVNKLADLYREEGEDKGDWQKVNRSPKKSFVRKLLSFTIFLAIIIAVAALGFLFFNQSQNNDKDEGMTLEISGPDMAKVGEEVEYTIYYNNTSNISVTKTELVLTYPKGWQMKETSIEPANSDKTTWNLGELKPHFSGKLEIKGTILGNIGEDQVLSAVVRYEPVNFSSSFSAENTKHTLLNSAPAEIKITGPDKLVGTQDIELTVSYENTGENDLGGLKLVMTYPEGFKFTSSEKPGTKENTTWDIGGLKKGEEGSFKIKGSILTSEGGGQSFDASLGIDGSQIGSSDTVFYTFAKANLMTLVVQPDVSLHLIIGGEQREMTADWSDILQYSIVLKNNGSNDLANLVVKATLDKDLLKWSDFQDNFHGAVADGMITWDQTKVPDLSLLKSNDEVTIDFSVPITELSSSMSGTQFSFVSKTEVTGDFVGLADQKLNVASNEVTVKINSKINFSAQARYYNDDSQAIGSGPIPPQAGQTTSYWINWKVINTTNTLNSVTIKATLPQNVTWADVSQADVGGDVDYNSATREVTWQIDNLGAESDSQVSVGAKFSVSVTPTDEQKGRVLTLLNPSTLSGVDSFTQENVNITQPALTTNLDGDPVAEGRGVVR